MNNAQAKAIADAAKSVGVTPTMTTSSVVSPDPVVDPHPKAAAPAGTMTTDSVTFEERPIKNTGDPWEGVEAKPLAAPAIDQIKSKNPNLAFRWVNRSCGTQTPNLRFEQCQAMGFVPATEHDCVPPPGSLQDGVIRFYDVILMKIDRKRLLAAERWNNDRVNANVRRGGVIANAKQNFREEVTRAGADGTLRQKYPGKVTVYVPGQAEVEALG
jgi:hypothetical protein